MSEVEIKHVPLEKWHQENGAKMVPFAGYNMPVRYAGDKIEHATVRNAVGLFDVSHMGEFLIEGPEALDLIQYVFSNDASKLEDGGIQYGCLPNEKGGIVDDLLFYKISDSKYLTVVNASNIEKDFNWIKSHNTFDATLTDLSEGNCLFALQGPKAKDIIAKLGGGEAANLKYYTFGYYSFGDFKEVFISATGYNGSGGCELMISNDKAEALWELLIKEGQEHGIQPIGLGARDTLRLEKGYCLYGNDIDDTTSPYEAGLGWVVKLNKKTVASSWLEEQKENGVKKKLIGFIIEEKGIPRAHYKIHNKEGQEIGEVTSGTISPTAGYGIGMGYVPKQYASVDTEINIAVRNKMLKAKVIKMPFI